MAPEKFYLTTPIYYVNDVPHIGHAYTTIAADVLARYKRLAGYEVFFLTGTDEHGIKIERSARERGVSPQEWTDAISAHFRSLWERFNISYDDFIRTSQPRHKIVAQAVFQKAYDKGDIYKGLYEGWYCIPDETFLLESELQAGNCPICGRPVEWITEEAYFFRLSSYQDWIIAHIETHPTFIQPVSRRNEVLSFVRSGLRDLCVSRSTFTWGIPVPFDPSQVIYVWIDALTNYLTAIGYSSDPQTFQKFWPANIHLIGKEILRFHAVIWPILLRSAGLPPPMQVFAHGWWTVDGERISKSKGNGIDPGRLAEELAQKAGASVETAVDAIRYFVLREVAFGLDGDFSRVSLVQRFNADLANDLGNLLSRTLTMLQRYCQGVVPEPAAAESEANALAEAAAKLWPDIDPLLNELAFHKALARLWEYIRLVNRYVDEQAPWALARNPAQRRRLDTVLYNQMESLRLIALLLFPFMPYTAASIWRQLGIQGEIATQRLANATAWGGTRPGTPIQPGEQLFPRIDTGRPVSVSERTAEVAEVPTQEAPAVAVSYDEFQKLDLRVGRIVAAEPVPKANKLLKLTVDIGQQQRTVVAGIAQSYDPEALVGKTIILVANLAPRTLRGVESQGMVLAAESDGQIVLAGFDVAVQPGSKVK
ncbi:MAG TPA: methionine--tRNA ligase [Candidatus Tectomicrobia bacterium]|nr:methionine--tRNA ligase [Candidatus Tectomicrobia bacterium]